MINVGSAGLILLTVTLLSLNSFSQATSPSSAFSEYPVQHLMVTGAYIDKEIHETIPDNQRRLSFTNLNLDPSMMSESEQVSLADLKIAYGKIAKVGAAITNFWDFYKGTYSANLAQDRLSLQELEGLIERLTWFNKYFDLIMKKKFLRKMLQQSEIDNLEILVLKNTALKATLTLEIHRIYQTNSNSPEKLISREKSILELNHALSRLATLEASTKLCIGLF